MKLHYNTIRIMIGGVYLKKMILNKRVIMFLVCFVIFMWIALFLKLERNLWIDQMFLAVHKNTFLYNVFGFISWFGSKWGIISISIGSIIGLWWLKRNYYAILLIFIGVLGGDFVNKELKSYIGRERPLPIEEGFSFPSGHAMVGLILYGFLSYVIYLEKQSFNWLSYIIIFLIVLVGISRVILGVHYVSDVIGGFAIGGIILIGLITIYDLLITKTASNLQKDKKITF